MPVKIATYNGSAGDCYAYYSAVESSINYAADNCSRVINVSDAGVAASWPVLNAAQYAKG